VQYCRVFLQVVPHFDKPIGQAKIQTTNEFVKSIFFAKIQIHKTFVTKSVFFLSQGLYTKHQQILGQYYQHMNTKIKQNVVEFCDVYIFNVPTICQNTLTTIKELNCALLLITAKFISLNCKT